MDGHVPAGAADATPDNDALDAYLARPCHMIVEAASRCNFLCPLCLWTRNKRHGYLGLETFARFADQAAPTLRRLCFAGRGEPTLNPELYQILRKSVDRGIVTDLATNGSSLLADVDAILDSGIDYVNVSIEADNAEDYARYRVNGDFAQVTAGMARLAEEKQRRRLKKPGLRTCSVIFNFNEDHLAQLRGYFAGLGFEGFIFKSAHLGHGLLAEAEAALSRRWLPRDASKRRSQYNGLDAGRPCGFLQRGHLLWNGDICRCAIDHQAMVVGNINRESFEEIWTGPRSRDIVRQVIAGEFDKCAKCSFSGRHMQESDSSIYLI
jgi:radical SAM protein with 4Fe4S-binding SPASM domain